ncbi:MAG: S9 family peptidase [Myxococcota bacterium]|nr:S9 family peptidase [Myxococcota bacterium]
MSDNTTSGELNSKIDKRRNENPHLLPVEAFSGLPVAQDVRISPGGTYISFLKNTGGETALVTINIGTGDIQGLVKTDNRSKFIRWYEWSNDKYLLISILYENTDSPVRHYITRMLRATADGSEAPRPIVDANFDNVGILTNRTEIVSQFQDNVIDFLPDDPERVLLSADFKEPLFPGVYSLNITNGVRSLVKSHNRPIKEWMTDQRGEVRVGVGINKDYNRIIVKVRHAEKNKWKKAWEFAAHSAEQVFPLGFGLDPNALYVRAYHNDKKAVFKIDVGSPTLSRSLVASDDNYDILGSLIYSPKTRDPIGVYHGEAEDTRIYFDEAYKKFQASIDRVLPDTTNYIVDLTRNERRYVVFSTADDTPGTYYWGDRDRGTLERLFDTYPLLTKDKIPPTEKVVYKARDGVEIEAYLTVPAQQQGAMPTVLFPHGGPISRDYGGFDYWKVFFVNRGYAVFQPNFRGSSGYGRKFKMAAFEGFGKEMQDDLTDGANWLIDQGIADKDRMCIVGASYGGYAALMGAVKTPDLFTCAVSFAGFSDLKGFRDGKWFYANYKAIEALFGDDSAKLKENSPRRRADQIQIPILLVHGENDLTVPVDQSRVMAKALEDNQKEYKYIELEDGTHHLSNERNRIRLFQEMDLFLSEHLDASTR